MMYCYVVVFSGIRREEFTAHLRSHNIPDVPEWCAYLPYTVFVRSTLTAQKLSNQLLLAIPGLIRILVLDAKTDRSGRMPREAWEFLNPNPEGG
jgi:hypothetical protein